MNHTHYYVTQAQQPARHEIARLQQVIVDLEKHLESVHHQAVLIGQTMKSKEDMEKYTQLVFNLRQGSENLISYKENLSKLLEMANLDFGKGIPEQCRREIYHFYHAGKYTQSQLANQYGVSQSAVSKIVNGQAPSPVEGVNPNGIASHGRL